jgi:hypothetical protein
MGADRGAGAGPEHPDTLKNRGNLAYWSGQADRSGNSSRMFTLALRSADLADLRLNRRLSHRAPRVCFMPSRCAIWARVSTDDQDTGSLVLGYHHPYCLGFSSRSAESHRSGPGSVASFFAIRRSPRLMP